MSGLARGGYGATWGLVTALSLPGATLGADWSAVVGNQTGYTDNVFEFSATRRLSLSEDPSQPTVVSVGRPSDVVWEPFAEVIRSFDHGSSRTDVSVKAQGFLYTTHTDFNHGTYYLQARHAFTPDTSILVRYRYTPDLFLGPNTERRTGAALVEEERITTHGWRVEAEQRLSASWRGALIARYGLRQYNAAFAERDTTFWTVGPQFSYHGFSRLLLTAGYLYELGLADGREDVQFKDDVSYHQHVAVAGTTLVLTDRLSLDLTYFYRLKIFTSTIAGDSNNGRRDDTHQGTAAVRYQATPALGLALEFQRTQRDSTRSDRAFFSDNVSLGVDYRF